MVRKAVCQVAPPSAAAVVLFSWAMFALLGSAQAANWPAWRGPLQTGASLETGLPGSTDEVLWRAPYGGRSTPAIVDGRVFGIDSAGSGVMEQERVFALDLKSGKELWQYRFNVFHTDIPSARVGWANVAADPETGYVYARGVEGMFYCFDRDGNVVWSRSLGETVGMISGYGGRTQSPVIDEDRVVISFLNSSFGDQAVGSHRYLAMDKRNGEILWWAAPGGKPQDTTYSVPVIAVVDGRRLLIDGNADGGIYAMQARSGQKVWGFQLSKRGINSSVVVDGHRVYATHSEENHDSTKMGRVVCIDARGSGDVTATHEIWRQDGIEAGYASPALNHGRLYVLNNSGLLHCFDADKGKQFWEHRVGRAGKGSPVCADGKIYVPTVNGHFVILEDAGSEARLIDEMSFESDREVIELFGSPAVSDGRVVFFTTRETVCLGRKDAPRQEVSIPSPGVESPCEANSPPALLQVRPGEVLIRPGQQVRFSALAFEQGGRPLGPVDVKWSYVGPGGEIGDDGRFRAVQQAGSIGQVTAQHGALSATARVRIVPDVPIVEDFESYQEGVVPTWWIGVSKAKYNVETIGGSKVLTKLADERGPIFNRSKVYITPPLPAGYTVQADVMGTQVGPRRGDVGLINDRYRLELFGGVGRLRVMSWVPGPRFEKRIDFSWQPDRWYRVKLYVGLADGKAQVRAKVWPRDEAEPEAWTLEAEDPQPNLEGSAGLYAYSMAPLYFDNVRIERAE